MQTRPKTTKMTMNFHAATFISRHADQEELQMQMEVSLKESIKLQLNMLVRRLQKII